MARLVVAAGGATAARKHRSTREIKAQRAKWHVGRRASFQLVESTIVKCTVGVCIVLNTALVVFETDLGATCDGKDSRCETDNTFTTSANIFFLVVYSLEAVMRFYAFRTEYFQSPSDMFDLFIVIVGIIGLFSSALPGVGILRLFRVARVTRAVKITKGCEEVKVFISGIGSAFRAILVGSVLIFFALFLFSIASVMLLNPVNQEIVGLGLYEDSGCDRCEVAYSSVSQSMLTLLQTVIMGDAWGDYAVPLIDYQPWTVTIFIATSFTISLGLTNLVLAVIVDKALENREVNLQKQASERAREVEDAQREFVDICAELDTDHSGFLSMDELFAGYEHENFHMVLRMLDIEREDLTHVFNIMDQDKSGQVSYQEFAYQLQNLKGQDLHTMVSFMKHYVFEIHEMVQQMHQMQLEANSMTAQPGGAGRALVTQSQRQQRREGTKSPRECPSPIFIEELAGETSAVKVSFEAMDTVPVVTPAGSIAAPTAGTNSNFMECAERARLADLQRGFDSQFRLLQDNLVSEIELRRSVLRASLLQDSCSVGKIPAADSVAEHQGAPLADASAVGACPYVSEPQTPEFGPPRSALSTTGSAACPPRAQPGKPPMYGRVSPPLMKAALPSNSSSSLRL